MIVTSSRAGRFVEVELIAGLLAEASEVDYALYDEILHKVLKLVPKEKLNSILSEYEDTVYGEVE